MILLLYKSYTHQAEPNKKLSSSNFEMAQLFASSAKHLMLCFVIFSFLLPFPSHSIDPSPLQDFCVADLDSSIRINGFPCKNPADVTSKDFFSSIFKDAGTISNKFNANITQGNVRRFPGLNTLGMSMNRVILFPGGTNPPHVHPRASELSVVLDGTLFVGWVSTANVFYWKVLTSGDLFVIPPGVVHFQLNVGKVKGSFYAAFNSQNPGLQIVSTALFNSTPSIPDEVLVKAFQVDEDIIETIRAGLATLRSSS